MIEAFRSCFRTPHVVNNPEVELCYGKIETGIGLLKKDAMYFLSLNKDANIITTTDDIIRLYPNDVNGYFLLWNPETFVSLTLSGITSIEDTSGMLTKIINDFQLSRIASYDEIINFYDKGVAFKAITTFIKTGGQSMTPIVMPANLDLFEDEYSCNYDYLGDITYVCDSYYRYLSEKYPNTDNEDERFVVCKFTVSNESATFIFNRNHKAYNGSMTAYDMLFPVVLSVSSRLVPNENQQSVGETELSNSQVVKEIDSLKRVAESRKGFFPNLKSAAGK